MQKRAKNELPQVVLEPSSPPDWTKIAAFTESLLLPMASTPAAQTLGKVSRALPLERDK